MKDVSLTIRTRKDTGKIQAIISVKEGTKWKQVQSKGGFNTKKEANQWAIPLLADWRTKVENEYENMTIARLKEIYMEDLKGRVRESTFHRAEVAFRNSTELDDYKIGDITPYQYRQHIEQMPTYNRTRYSAFYNFLINDLDMNIKNPYKTKKTKPKEKHPISYEDYQAILDIVKHKDCNMAIQIAYNTGARISEISGLTTSDIYKDHISINKQLNKATGKFTSTKSANGNRDIPITPEFYQTLQSFISSKKIIGIDGRLFQQKNPASTLSRTINQYLKPTKYKGTSFHYFRHTFITNLVISGLDLLTVAYLAGDDLNTITSTYIHLTKKNYDIAKDFITDNKMVKI